MDNFVCNVRMEQYFYNSIIDPLSRGEDGSMSLLGIALERHQSSRPALEQGDGGWRVCLCHGLTIESVSGSARDDSHT